MKVINTNIEDANPSVFQLYWTVREIVWGLVEAVKDQTEQGASQRSPESDCDDDDRFVGVDDDLLYSEESLPSSFGSNRRPVSKKRKRKADTPKLKYIPMTAIQKTNLPKWKYSGSPMFENLFMIIGIDGLYYPGICCGCGLGRLAASHLDDGGRYKECTTCMVRYLGNKHMKPFEVYRHPDYLKPIPDDYLAYAISLMESEPIDIPIPEDLVGLDKYWDQRYRLCSKYDLGIQLDHESWYSITPEAVGRHIAKNCIRELRRGKRTWGIVVECFSGCGGTIISLAAEACEQQMNIKLVGVEIDPVKAAMCLHNASLYGVSASIDVICADVYDYLNKDHYITRNLNLASVRSSGGSNNIDRLFGCNFHVRFADNDGIAVDPATTSSDEAVDLIPDFSLISENSQPTVEVIKETSASIRSVVDKETAGNQASHVETIEVTESLDTNATDESAEIHSKHDLVDVIVMSPPWGGPAYAEESVFRMSSMLTCGDGNGIELIKLALSVSQNLILILPKNISKREFGHIRTIVALPCIIENICLYGKHKLSVVYIGRMFAKM